MNYTTLNIIISIFNVITFTFLFIKFIKLTDFYQKSINEKSLIFENERRKLPDEIKKRVESYTDGTFEKFIYEKVHKYIENNSFEILKDTFKRITSYHFWGSEADMVKQSIVDILIKEIEKTEVEKEKELNKND